MNKLTCNITPGTVYFNKTRYIDVTIMKRGIEIHKSLTYVPGPHDDTCRHLQLYDIPAVFLSSFFTKQNNE